MTRPHDRVVAVLEVLGPARRVRVVARRERPCPRCRRGGSPVAVVVDRVAVADVAGTDDDRLDGRRGGTVAGDGETAVADADGEAADRCRG